MNNKIPTKVRLVEGKNKWKIIAIIFGILLLFVGGIVGYGLFNSMVINSYNQGSQDSFTVIYNTIKQNGYILFNIDNKEMICHENNGEV